MTRAETLNLLLLELQPLFQTKGVYYTVYADIKEGEDISRTKVDSQDKVFLVIFFTDWYIDFFAEEL